MELGQLMVRAIACSLNKNGCLLPCLNSDQRTTSTTILHPLTKTEQYQYVILKDGARGRIVAPPTGAMFI